MASGYDRPTALSARGVARRLGVSADLVIREIRAGRLEAHRLGKRRLLITERAVAEWLEARRVRPTAHAEARLREVLEREERRAS